MTGVLSRVVSITTAILMLGAPSARAFFDPPWITPAAPQADEIVSVSIRGGICDAIFERPGFPQITQQGNAIRILEYGHHWDDADLCIYNVGTLVQPIGSFPEGSYTLTVDFVYPDILGPTTITLGTIPLTVSSVASAAPVPALTPLSALALFTLLMSVARWALAGRRGIGLKGVRFLAILILIAAFVLDAPSALAFFDPPWITPSSPTSNDVVSVNIRGGICDGIFFRQGYPQITQQGHSIRILEYGHHWEDLDLCIYDIGTLVAPIGTFSPGDYTLTVDFTYEDYPFGYTTTTLGVVPFTVVGATPATPVPALTMFGELVLLTSICVACCDLAVRRGRSI